MLEQLSMSIFGNINLQAKCEGHGKQEEVSIVEILAGGGKVCSKTSTVEYPYC